MSNPIDHLINEHIRALGSKELGALKINNSIRLDKGELPYPPSAYVTKAITDAISTINRYPDVLGGTLRESLAHYTGARKEQIVIGNGSDDLIELIIKTFVKPGEEVLLPVPTFFVYWHATQMMGGNPVFISRTADFSLDVQALLQKVTPNTKVLFIANPNNPTANLIPRDVILSALNHLNCIVVIDECYYEFCKETAIDLIEKYPNLIILRSLSKSFGLAGLRVGYAITNEEISDYLYRCAQLFPVNKLALAGAIAALEDKSYAYSNILKICQERTSLAHELTALGFSVYPSATNFLFLSTKPLEITSDSLVSALRKRNIFVQDFGMKPGLDEFCLRVSVGTPEENHEFIRVLREEILVISI